MRTAARVDTNHGAIVDGIRQIFGPDSVLDLSRVGQGCPDILVGIRGHNIMLEIKTDRGKLTADQVYFHREWGGQVAVIRTLADALAIISDITT